MVTIPTFFLLAQLFALIFNYIPESPNSLIRKNRSEEAKEIIGMFLIDSEIENAYK